MRLRTSPAKLLILVALCLVVLVELRTALAFVGVPLSIGATAAIGAAAIALLVLWAVQPAGGAK